MMQRSAAFVLGLFAAAAIGCESTGDRVEQRGERTGQQVEQRTDQEIDRAVDRQLDRLFR